jgi:hypothetical protein
MRKGMKVGWFLLAVVPIPLVGGCNGILGISQLSADGGPDSGNSGNVPAFEVACDSYQTMLGENSTNACSTCLSESESRCAYYFDSTCKQDSFNCGDSCSKDYGAGVCTCLADCLDNGCVNQASSYIACLTNYCAGCTSEDAGSDAEVAETEPEASEPDASEAAATTCPACPAPSYAGVTQVECSTGTCLYPGAFCNADPTGLAISGTDCVCPANSTCGPTGCVCNSGYQATYCDGTPCSGALCGQDFMCSPTITRQPTTCPTGMTQLPAGQYIFSETGAYVTVPAFCMDQTEVTVSAYETCVNQGLCTAANTVEYWPGGITRSDECNWNVAGRLNDPVNCVSYAQADQYCAYLHKRLPTEAEWEWADRQATYGYTYPWGNFAPSQTSSYACWDWNSAGQTCPVESYPAGRGLYYPLYDLAGNVWEFTMSTTAGEYVVRGGGFWDSTAANFASTAKNTPGQISSGVQVEDAGFRCVLGLGTGGFGTACSTAYLAANCSTFTVGSVVSYGSENYTCTNANCRFCSAYPGCAPGGTTCPYGTVWTAQGPCTPVP